ncbi:hypothetical protein PNEG_01734 [Pneumocystis murina B123]|uniref:CHCH domain-containing protein n=1 Tax=Pneumocystis murina (strain B123) TaxID=1069680 RepID=M7PHN8_PNEMU|nr:hypothetical protein PNEG_01734 [Pneumocystis murina B123]EMR09974.1 hypothetical protein PNEG_01734 [Pneumocystis murina B123]
MSIIPHFRLKKLKVKPKRNRTISPCITEMSAMLGCWAAHGGQPDAIACKAFVVALENCMKEKTRKNQTVNTINYHLSRLKKWL